MRCWISETHHRILLKFHKCLSFSTPVAKTCDYFTVFWCELWCQTSVLTPDMRVIHTRLVIGQSDEGRVGGPLVNQVQQNLVVVDRQAVHVLWRWRDWEGGYYWYILVLYWDMVCLYVYIPTYWSRSRNRSPPCPWSVSWRSSMPKQGTVGTAIWPPGASQRSTDTTSTHTLTWNHQTQWETARGTLNSGGNVFYFLGLVWGKGKLRRVYTVYSSRPGLLAF